MSQEGQLSEDPFRATKLWKEVITQFRDGMPCKRRRVKVHFYDRCFSGSEAVQWLHNHLNTTRIFGDAVSRHKVEKLLKKFLSSDVIEEVRGKTEEFSEDPGYLYKFVTKPGPFNFVGDENSTPCKTKRRPRPVTPAAALRKRKRKEVEEGSETMDYDGALFSNEYASTSCDEESFHAVVTPLRGGGRSPRRATVRNSGGLRRMSGVNERSIRSRNSSGAPTTVGRLCSGGLVGKENSGETMESDVMLEESPPKRCRKDGGSFSGGASMGGGATEVDPAILTKVWKELTLNRLLLLIELPSLDGVLTHDAVDGRHIALNVARVVGGACSAVGGACSSAAQTCLAAVSGSSHYQPRLPPPPPAPASHVTRRRSSGRLRSPFHTHHHHHWHRVSSDSTHHGGTVGDFPQWLTLSMHCLSKWPTSCSEEFVGGMPIYGGFELDVFQSLAQFFRSEPEPLISTALHDLFMAVLKLVKSCHAHSVEAMQLCFLMLPQQNRLRLHQVLNFMSTASSNPQLRLSKTQSNLSVLMEKLGPAILRRCNRMGGQSSESVSSTSDLCTLVAFMVRHHRSILKVPEDLKREVQQRTAQLKQGKGSPVEVKHVFCRQVSAAQYEEQKSSHTHQHMGALLEGILADSRMSDKDKYSKLKMFQKQYPDVYTYKMLEKPHPLLELVNKDAKSQRKSGKHSR